MSKPKTISLVVLVIFYFLAGVNHFIHPAFYIGIIPSYLPAPKALNTAAGCCEIVLALLMIPGKSRKFAAWCIMLMLMAFLPVHIGMAVHVPLSFDKAEMTPLLIWARLVIMQPLLIWWVWWYTRRNKNFKPHPL